MTEANLAFDRRRLLLSIAYFSAVFVLMGASLVWALSRPGSLSIRSLGYLAVAFVALPIGGVGFLGFLAAAIRRRSFFVSRDRLVFMHRLTWSVRIQDVQSVAEASRNGCLEFTHRGGRVKTLGVSLLSSSPADVALAVPQLIRLT